MRDTGHRMIYLHADSAGEAGERESEGNDGGFVCYAVVCGWDVLVMVCIDAEGVRAAEGEGEFDFEGVETPPG